MTERATADRPLRAVLWDMDGTLLDSERVWDISLAELALSLGGVLSSPARAAMVGMNMATSMVILYADLGITDRDELVDARWLDERTAQLFETGLIWRPGARALLREVRRAGLTTALVTSTSRPLVTQALRTLGADNFEAVVCGGETPRAKPHPDPYLAALGLLKVEAQQVVVIEDSPAGVASAVAAGCLVLAVPCAVPLEVGPGVVLRSSLTGLTVQDLRCLLVAAGQSTTPPAGAGCPRS